MNETQQQQKQQALATARRDLLIAGAVAAVVMVGVALFAPEKHLWGVALGALISLANLSILARIGSHLVASEQPKPTVALLAVAKVLGLMAVIIAVLFTRPTMAFGLCLGLALPAVVGGILVLRSSAQYAQMIKHLKPGGTRD